MKINDSRNRVRQYFSSTYCVGNVFDYENEIYMMIGEITDEDGTYYNAVCLNDGELAHFNNEKVQILDNVTLEIH